MKKISKIYYINLDRVPTRNEHFLNQCKLQDISSEQIVRYSALDGKSYQFSDEEIQMFINVNYKYETYARNIMGNQLSHYNILLEVIQNGYDYAMVCQDDVIFRDDFNQQLEIVMDNIPDDAEIINIGFHKSAVLSWFIPWNLSKINEDDSLGKTIVNDGVHILKNSVNPCSLAYIITLNGAKNIVEYFNTCGFLQATDHNFNEYLKSKNIFYGSRIVLCTGNNLLSSDIFV
jgi:GR25 family glycosyltransferase involved in LPS biosynthesis